MLKKTMMTPLSNMHPQYLTDAEGQKVAVVLPIEEFSALIEDLLDLAAVVERHDEPTKTHEEFVKELKKDGYL